MAEPSGTMSRWKVHSEAYPAASALAANAARLSGVAQMPETGAPNPIRIPHTLGSLVSKTQQTRTESPAVTSDPHALIGILRNSHDRLAGLVQPLGPEQLRAQSYDDDWTIAQVLSHLGSGAEIATLNMSAALGGTGQLDRAAFQPVWDAWNARTPEAQAADALTWDEQHVSRLEQLTDEQLAAIRLDLFGRQLDAAGLIRMRLSEHAMHTWDVAVAGDPAATVAPDAVPEVLEQISQLLSFVAKPAGDSFRVRLRTTSPDGDYLLDVGEPVTLSAWVDGTEVDGVLELPAEALLRLLYGRLDPEHTPAYTAEGIDLDRLRAVFPGF